MALARGIRRNGGLHSRLEFFEIDFRVAIKVETSKNAHDFFLRRDVAALSQESLQISLVAIAVIPVVNCLECFLGGVVVRIFEVAFELVTFQMVAHFFEQKLAHSSFNSHR